MSSPLYAGGRSLLARIAASIRPEARPPRYFVSFEIAVTKVETQESAPTAVDSNAANIGKLISPW
jgi:hypothetical protein